MTSSLVLPWLEETQLASCRYLGWKSDSQTATDAMTAAGGGEGTHALSFLSCLRHQVYFRQGLPTVLLYRFERPQVCVTRRNKGSEWHVYTGNYQQMQHVSFHDKTIILVYPQVRCTVLGRCQDGRL